MVEVHLEQLEFVGGCPVQLRCRRCSCLEVGLSRARCGHGFCSRCVGLARAARFQCPLDSRSIDKNELVPDLDIREQLLRLPVYCLQRKKGCKRTMALQQLEAHLESCGFVGVACPVGCGLQVSKRDLPDHLTSACERRLVPCPFCADDVVFSHVQAHDEVCGQRPVTCLHCKAEVKREQLSCHELSCPMKPRCCSLSDVGCTFKGNSDELERHSGDVNVHIRAMADVIARHTMHIKTLEEKLEDTLQENLKLNEQLQDLYPVLGTVKGLEKAVSMLIGKVKGLEIAEQTVEEMNETLAKLKDYMQRSEPAVVQDHKSTHGLFVHNQSFEEQKMKHAAPPTDL